jgi:hypothetical protein
MTFRLGRLIRIAACVVSVTAFYVLQTAPLAGAASANSVLQTAPIAGAESARLFGDCFDDEVCGPEFSCDDPCWSYAPELPPFESTCGDYGGEPWNGLGNCLGECGDTYCNPFNDEEYGIEGCPVDCGYCGDDTCDSPLYESPSRCPMDCGFCGDDICNDWEGHGQTGYCPQDCGEIGEGQPGEECEFPSNPCPAGQYCTPFNYCAENGIECTELEHNYLCIDSSECCEYETCHIPDDPGCASGEQSCIFPRRLVYDDDPEVLDWVWVQQGVCIPAVPESGPMCMIR